MKSGAAPLSAELIRQLSEILPNMSIGQSYGTLPFSSLAKAHGLVLTDCWIIGMTETCTTVTFPQIEQKIGTPGSAGRLHPGIVARVLKPDGSLARYGEPGQLVIKGPSNALCYLDNAEAYD